MPDSRRIVYAGTPDFAVPPLEALVEAGYEVVAVYTQPDRPAGRGRKLKASPVKQAAERLGIPVYQPHSLRDPEEQDRLAGLEPDLMVVAAYGQILPREVLSLPRLGCVNIHASLLPRWRGAAPIHRAILEGDAETGVTVMQMDVGLDTGDMLAKRRLPIQAGETAGELHDRLAKLGAEALLEAMPGILAGELQGEPQDESQATYARKLEKSESWIDWHRPAEAIARQVGALNPWPVAQTEWDGKILRIWRAEALERGSDVAPGRVIEARESGIEVATANGTLRILELQLPGKRPVSVADFVNAHNIEGAMLG